MQANKSLFWLNNGLVSRKRRDALLFAATLVVAFFTGCQQQTESAEEAEKDVMDSEAFVRNQEAREDSIELAEAYALMAEAQHVIYPDFQTIPVDANSMDDAADDPAFWLNPADPEGSLIFGSNKKGGIYAYSMQGETVAYYELGLINNIDTRSGIVVGDKELDVIGGSNRTDNSITLMQIDASGALTDLLAESFTIDTHYVDEVYGFCMYKDAEGTGYAIVNGKNGRIVAYKIEAGAEEQIMLTEVFTWKLDTQPEGMVADDALGVLYVGEEQYGIWKMDLVSDSQPQVLPDSRPANNDAIHYDIEGLALYTPTEGDGEGYLLASIQGSFTYALFERGGDNRFLTHFRIGEADGMDAVEETDGLEIVSAGVGASFPNGLLIVQDGFNYEGDDMVSQNFKVIDLQKVLDLVVD